MDNQEVKDNKQAFLSSDAIPSGTSKLQPLAMPQSGARKAGSSPLSKPIAYSGDEKSRETFYSILVYGESDSGKTYLLRTWPNPKEVYHIDTKLEENYPTLDGTGIPHVEIESWPQLVEYVEDLVADLEGTTGFPTKIVCFDSLTIFQHLFMSQYAADAGKDYFGAPGARERKGQDWFVLRNAFMRVIERSKLIRAHKIYICAETLPSDFNESTTNRKVMPSLSGQLMTLVRSVCSVVAHAQKIQNVDKTVTRILTPVDVGQFVGRNRGGRLRNVEEPNLAAIIKRLNGEEE